MERRDPRWIMNEERSFLRLNERMKDVGFSNLDRISSLSLVYLLFSTSVITKKKIVEVG